MKKFVTICGIFFLTSKGSFSQSGKDSSTNLSAVTVNGVKPFITQSGGKMILQVAQSPLAAGGNAYEVVLRAPGVLEQNGSLSLSGRSVNMLIDGRPTHLSGEELKNMLSNMPANGIDKIEILSNPSAKYDARGGSVINIRLAKNQNYGVNGSVMGGLGTGKYVRGSSGLSLNYRDKHMNIYGSYDYQYNQQYYDNSSLRSLAAEGSISENEYDVRRRNNHAYKAGLDYEINKNSSWGVLLKGSTNFRERTVNDRSAATHKEIVDSSSTVFTTGYARFFNPSANLYFRTKLDASGKKELVINADYLSYNKQWDDAFVTHSFDAAGTETLPPLYLRDHSPADNKIRSLTADYTQHTKAGKWEGGIKTNFTTTDNDVRWEQQSEDHWLTDPGKTNHFIYKENINAAYLTFDKTLHKVGLQVGMRAEQTNTESRSVTLDDLQRRSYFNLFPNLQLQYNPSPKQQFGLSYRKSIERFGFDYVNPFIVYQSQYAYSKGNPDIRPMILHTIEVSHSWQYKLFTKFSYTRMLNVLGPLYLQDSAKNAVISTYGNLRSANVFSGNVMAVKSFFRGKWISVNTVGGFYAKYEAGSYGTDEVNARITGYVSSNNTTMLPGKIKAECTLYYFSPIAMGVYRQRSQFSAGLGLSKSLLKSKGSLALNVTDLFNSQRTRNDVSSQEVNIRYDNKAESRYLNLVFTYKFGNNRVRGSKSRTTGIEDEKNRMGAN